MYRYTHTWMETPVISWLVTKVSWMQVNNVCLHLFDAAFSKWNLFSFNYRNSYHIVLIIWSKFITAYFSRNTRTHDNYYVILRYRYSPQDLICIFLACILTRNIRLISIFGFLFFPRFVPHRWKPNETNPKWQCHYGFNLQSIHGRTNTQTKGGCIEPLSKELSQMYIRKWLTDCAKQFADIHCEQWISLV